MVNPQRQLLQVASLLPCLFLTFFVVACGFVGGSSSEVRQGKITYYNGEYVGEVKNGIRHGHGTYTWNKGDKYTGEYKDGKQHGQGTFIWTTNAQHAGSYAGDKYVGEFKDDKFDGQGVYTGSDGWKFVGQFKNGLRHGDGTMNLADGSYTSGIWENGKLISQRSTSSIGPPKSTSKFEVMPPPRQTIRLVQRYLTELGHNPGPIDGQLGPRTRNSIRSFQRSASGDVGENGLVSSRLINAMIAQLRTKERLDQPKQTRETYSKEIKDLIKQSKQANVDAQYNLSLRFAKGQGVAKNLVLAHMWAKLSIIETSGKANEAKRLEAMSLSLNISLKMTKNQKELSHKLANQCIYSSYKHCG
jgi:hypothetical protein